VDDRNAPAASHPYLAIGAIAENQSRCAARQTSTGLSAGITKKISPAQVVIFLGGMYAAHSAWIGYAIEEAQRTGKTIIGVRPWGQERVPLIVRSASICEVVGWNRTSVINAIRAYC
jgi:hypothetical protein